MVPIFGVGTLLFLIPFIILAYWGMEYGIPIVNRVLSVIWEDPTQRQRLAVLKRLKELHVGQEMPPDVSVLLASKEFKAGELETLRTAGILDPADLAKMARGNRGWFAKAISALDRYLKRS